MGDEGVYPLYVTANYLASLLLLTGKSPGKGEVLGSLPHSKKGGAREDREKEG